MFTVFVLLALVQGALLSGSYPVTVWAETATAVGLVIFFVLGCFSWADTLRRVEEKAAAGSRSNPPGVPRPPGGPQIEARDSIVKGLNTSSPGFGESQRRGRRRIGGGG
jgi:hypothetical protein